ncbi:class I SAM-dependent methyltransferase [Mucisphaera calidilacus]|nr:class I SAM-dependent methyltransferase [Mucisphaera calidilacus]
MHTAISLRARLLVALEGLFPPAESGPMSESAQPEHEYAKAAGSYQRFVDELGGVDGLRVLDFGCGWGGESVWLAERGAEVTGCDISASAIEHAQRFAAERGVAGVDFALSDSTRLPFADDSFDAVFSTDVFEHVMDLPAVLGELRRVLRPGGVLLTRFGPLFYSPLGYHLPWTTQVPWAHLVFGLRPIVEVRNTRRSPISPGSWEETGLNRATFGAFREAVGLSGFEAERLERIPVRGLRVLAGLPGVGDLFTFGVDARLVA